MHIYMCIYKNKKFFFETDLYTVVTTTVNSLAVFGSLLLSLIM